MMYGKGKKIVSSELYEAKKAKQVDHLFKMIENVKKNQAKNLIQLNQPSQVQQVLKKKMIEKRVKMILNNYHESKVSEPDPYVKRTWVSPLLKAVGSAEEEMIPNFRLRRKSQEEYETLSQRMKLEKVCKILNINKKMHLFGEFMYCDFDGKENSPVSMLKSKESQIQILNKKYKKMFNNGKEQLLICSNNSSLNKKIFHNPLKNDKYFEKIIKKNDTDLIKILIRMLSNNGNFTFSSYLEFYNIFVWQQASKSEQIEFVCKLLMGEHGITSFSELSQKIDYFCGKINLMNHQSLQGFNEVMKKLIFGQEYESIEEDDRYMTKDQVKMSLDMNEECISIFINVFYSQ